jgi:murein DD-endopeptidase MepM/ murein hydrolase activator NlpD
MLATVAQFVVPLILAVTTGVWPLDPRPEVVAGFDPPTTAYGAGHRGVDLAGTTGQPVRAALDGVVTYAGLLAGRGVVVVSHGVTRTTYEPVDATVRVGDRVRAGQVIGRLAWTGSHCRPAACLHWGLLRGDTYLDPLSLVGAGPVRLLPLAAQLSPMAGPAEWTPGRAAMPGSAAWLTGGQLPWSDPGPPPWLTTGPSPGPSPGSAPESGRAAGSDPAAMPQAPLARHVGVPGGMPGEAGP